MHVPMGMCAASCAGSETLLCLFSTYSVCLLVCLFSPVFGFGPVTDGVLMQQANIFTTKLHSTGFMVHIDLIMIGMLMGYGIWLQFCGSFGPSAGTIKAAAASRRCKHSGFLRCVRSGPVRWTRRDVGDGVDWRQQHGSSASAPGCEGLLGS